MSFDPIPTILAVSKMASEIRALTEERDALKASTEGAIKTASEKAAKAERESIVAMLLEESKSRADTPKRILLEAARLIENKWHLWPPQEAK
jgi:hypothetical protein